MAKVAAAGGKIIVMPHADTAVIAAAKVITPSHAKRHPATLLRPPPPPCRAFKSAAWAGAATER